MERTRASVAAIEKIIIDERAAAAAAEAAGAKKMTAQLPAAGTKVDKIGEPIKRVEEVNLRDSFVVSLVDKTAAAADASPAAAAAPAKGMPSVDSKPVKLAEDIKLAQEGGGGGEEEHLVAAPVLSQV
jgi:hypothetical protein